MQNGLLDMQKVKFTGSVLDPIRCHIRNQKIGTNYRLSLIPCPIYIINMYRLIGVLTAILEKSFKNILLNSALDKS